MMNLNEAIDHAREKAEQLKDHANKWKHSSEVCDSEFVREKAAEKCEECLECAKDHEQLSEWLEELTKYRGKIEDLIDGNLTRQEFCFYVIDIYMNAIEKEQP